MFRGVVVAKGSCYAELPSSVLGNHPTPRLRHCFDAADPVRLFAVSCRAKKAIPLTTERATSVSSYLSLFGLRHELTAMLAGFPGILIEEPCDRLTVFAYWLNSSGQQGSGA